MGYNPQDALPDLGRTGLRPHARSANNPSRHKPANILYQGDNFLLTAFGIAKVVDASRTMVGTAWYMAPEVLENGEQTPKVDIYGLGATAVECLVKLPSEENRRAIQHWRQWHEYLQRELNQHAPHMAQMLEEVSRQRPTARELLDALVNQFIHVPLLCNGTWTSFGVSSLYEPDKWGDNDIFGSTYFHGLDTNGSHSIFPGKSSVYAAIAAKCSGSYITKVVSQ